MTIQVKKIHKDATFKKAYSSDSGYDLTACTYEYKGEGLWMIGLGVQVKPQRGTYFEIIPRSGFCKLPFIIPNNVGIIDQHYRGEWMLPIRSMGRLYWNKDVSLSTEVPLVNQIAHFIEKLLIGKRVVQAIVRTSYNFEIEFMSEDYQFSHTLRGERGFGSTGEK